MIYDPEELVRIAHAMSGPLERWLKWREIRERFERGKNSIFAKCFLKAEGGTVKEREMVAASAEEFMKYLDDLHEAAKSEISARVEYENLKNQFDAMTSALAYQRESMKRLGG